MALYPWLESVLEEQYRPVCRLRKTERNEIVLLEQKERHVRIVKRIFAGGSDVYRKLLTLKHKNMPEILEVTEFGDRTLVLEEYIDGVTLWDLMQEEGYYTEKAVRSLMSELCDVLAMLHAQNIVHRDIKPQNIMIENNTHTLKLIDFDSARLIKPCYPNDTEYLGTVGYAAPEQYGEVQTDTRADIYSIGILMNELLTKKRPSELLYPGKLQKVIVKCIQVSPDKRFQTAEKLKRSLHG